MNERRLPAIDKQISEITDKDIRVRITGSVIDKGDGFIVVDDGTGKIKVSFDGETSDIVRVFGRVIPLENGFEINGEIIQDMSKLDLNLRKKVIECLKQ